MHNPLGQGNKSSAFGERGITKRLDALGCRVDLRGNRLLDIGCGDGAYTVRLADGFAAVDAIDVQDGPLALFRERLEGTPAAGHITIGEMSAAKLDFPDDTFDLVTAIEVLEHVEELDQALEEIRRVLSPAAGSRSALLTGGSRSRPTASSTAESVTRRPGRRS